MDEQVKLLLVKSLAMLRGPATPPTTNFTKAYNATLHEHLRGVLQNIVRGLNETSMERNIAIDTLKGERRSHNQVESQCFRHPPSLPKVQHHARYG